VIVVQKGNPKKISGLRDLARPGLRVVLTHQEYSTTGQLVSRMTDKAGIDLGSNVVSRTRGGGAAANAVMLGTADAAVVWDAVAYLRRDKLDSVPLEPDVKLKRGVDAVTTATFKRIEMDYIRVTMASLSVSSQPEAASRFGDFVASEKNADVWKKFGFSAPDRARDREGKKGESILVQCAAGMRLPVSEMASEFERKHGVKVELAYDGSNRLLGSIKLTRKGDVYIAGDADYIDMAGKAGLVDESAAGCRFEPVMMVRKGNPKKILTLADMAKSGLKIGQADEQATAIGRLMPKLLGLNGVDRKLWKKNIVLTTTTVNELAMAIKLGTVDAVVVWNAVAAKYADDSEIVKIAENITPAVGAAVLSCGKNRQDGAAFLKFMQSRRGRDIMKRNGYLPVD
jgi:molybdate transport system substrate-binding protein